MSGYDLRERFSRILTLPRGRNYITAVVKRGDSVREAGFHHKAKPEFTFGEIERVSKGDGRSGRLAFFSGMKQPVRSTVKSHPRLQPASPVFFFRV